MPSLWMLPLHQLLNPLKSFFIMHDFLNKQNKTNQSAHSPAHSEQKNITGYYNDLEKEGNHPYDLYSPASTAPSDLPIQRVEDPNLTILSEAKTKDSAHKKEQEELTKEGKKEETQIPKSKQNTYNDLSNKTNKIDKQLGGISDLNKKIDSKVNKESSEEANFNTLSNLYIEKENAEGDIEKVLLDTRKDFNSWWKPIALNGPKSEDYKSKQLYFEADSKYKSSFHYYEKLQRVNTIETLTQAIFKRDVQSEKFNSLNDNKNDIRNEVRKASQGDKFSSLEEENKKNKTAKNNLKIHNYNDNKERLSFENGENPKEKKANRKQAAHEKAVLLLNQKTKEKINERGEPGAKDIAKIENKLKKKGGDENSLSNGDVNKLHHKENKELGQELFGAPKEKEKVEKKTSAKEAAQNMVNKYVFSEDRDNLEALSSSEKSLILEYLLKGELKEYDKWMVIMFMKSQVNDPKEIDAIFNYEEGGLSPSTYIDKLKDGVSHTKLKKQLKDKGQWNSVEARHKNDEFKKIKKGLQSERDNNKTDAKGNVTSYGRDHYEKEFQKEVSQAEKDKGRPLTDSERLEVESNSENYDQYWVLTKAYKKALTKEKINFRPESIESNFTGNFKNNEYLEKLNHTKSQEDKEKEAKRTEDRLPDAIHHFDVGSNSSNYDKGPLWGNVNSLGTHISKEIGSISIQLPNPKVGDAKNMMEAINQEGASDADKLAAQWDYYTKHYTSEKSMKVFGVAFDGNKNAINSDKYNNFSEWVAAKGNKELLKEISGNLELKDDKVEDIKSDAELTGKHVLDKSLSGLQNYAMEKGSPLLNYGKNMLDPLLKSDALKYTGIGLGSAAGLGLLYDGFSKQKEPSFLLNALNAEGVGSSLTPLLNNKLKNSRSYDIIGGKTTKDWSLGLDLSHDPLDGGNKDYKTSFAPYRSFLNNTNELHSDGKQNKFSQYYASLMYNNKTSTTMNNGDKKTSDFNLYGNIHQYTAQKENRERLLLEDALLMYAKPDDYLDWWAGTKGLFKGNMEDILKKDDQGNTEISKDQNYLGANQPNNFVTTSRLGSKYAYNQQDKQNENRFGFNAYANYLYAQGHNKPGDPNAPSPIPANNDLHLLNFGAGINGQKTFNNGISFGGSAAYNTNWVMNYGSLADAPNSVDGGLSQKDKTNANQSNLSVSANFKMAMLSLDAGANFDLNARKDPTYHINLIVKLLKTNDYALESFAKFKTQNNGVDGNTYNSFNAGINLRFGK